MKYEDAKTLGEVVLERLKPYIEKGIIAGSVRRKKAECHDVDLVIIPKREFMVMENIKAILRQYGKFDKQGKDILIVKDEVKETQVDCYIANEKTYEMVLLIRTGSKEHNVKLAQKAIQKGYSLKHGLGLVDKETGRVVANTERKIFDELELEYVEPRKR
jgi:DNA polymerase (family X)